MSDSEKVALLALMLGDVPNGPYYPMFTEQQYMQFLNANGGNINKAVIFAAISAGYIVAGESSREVIGELQISSNAGTNYLKLLDHLIRQAGKVPPPNLMPWFGADGRNKLLDYSVCDVHDYDTFTCKWRGC